MLGAVGLGDIGTRFPPSNEYWRDVSSLDLMARVAALVGEAGWRRVKVDVTVIAERPRLAPNALAMRTSPRV